MYKISRRNFLKLNSFFLVNLLLLKTNFIQNLNKKYKIKKNWILSERD